MNENVDLPMIFPNKDTIQPPSRKTESETAMWTGKTTYDTLLIESMCILYSFYKDMNVYQTKKEIF